VGIGPRLAQIRKNYKQASEVFKFLNFALDGKSEAVLDIA